MDWASLAGQVAALGAPILGGILGGVVGGPAGAALGSQAGKLLANALGTDPTPEAVQAAIQSDPAAVAKVQAVEHAHGDDLAALQAQLAADVKNVSDVNETMRAEAASPTFRGNFVSWARPACIYSVAFVTMGYGLCIVAAAGRSVVTGDIGVLMALVQMAPVLGVALAPAGAVAGVTAWGRTKEKIAGALDGNPVVTVPVGRMALKKAS